MTEQTQRLKDELNGKFGITKARDKLTHIYTHIEVNQELSVMRNQSSKQSEFIAELEGKLEEMEKKSRQQAAQQAAQQQNMNRSPTPDRATNYYDPYSRNRSTRIPRTPAAPGALSASSNPVKMVQEMVGRVRVSIFNAISSVRFFTK